MGMSPTQVERVLGLKMSLKNEKTIVFGRNFRISDGGVKVDVGVKQFWYFYLTQPEIPIQLKGIKMLSL